LMTIAQTSADWLLLVDVAQRILFVNRALRGMQPDEIVGRTIGEVSQPGANEYMTRLVDEVLTRGVPRDIEQIYHDPERGRRVFELRLRPVKERSRIAGAVINATEITRRREADELRETQARMLETLSEAVAMVQPNGIIRLANASFDRLFGFAAGGAVGTSLAHLIQVVGEDEDSVVSQLLREAAAHPATTRAEREFMRCDGEIFTASVAAVGIQSAAGANWLVIFTDVTERKRMEREILEIANREQLRIGSDLHDGLGQDLTGIALMLRGVAVQLRKEDSTVQGDVEEVIALVNGAIENTRSLARGLSPVGADRGGLISALQAMASRSMERYGVRTVLTTRLTEPLRLDDARASHLYRIAQEALTNAVRHGRVSDVEMELATAGGQLTLTVRDNGQGLQAPISRRDGMGLKLMRYRAQMIEGALEVANHPAGGLMVRCTCPHRVSGDSISRSSGGLPLKD
jgi:PAS domain S-box-containing protein